MQPLIGARRRWALRAMLSVAGGGLTAAGLAAGPFSSAAFAAGTPIPADGASSQATVPSSSPAPAETGATQLSTSTSTTPTTTATTTAPPAASTSPQTSTPPPAEAPTVVLQRRQRTTRAAKDPTLTATKSKKNKKQQGPNNVQASPQTVAQAGALAAILASSDASAQALAFYRIPLFLLPIYKAAAVQYGVPWQVLAAINEVETNYGTDLAVSSAGAVGWMQFMPPTWLQYGVDALNAGYADPYNPVDAIFAAARYLRAAGAADDLHGAILAYNHSEEYARSVLLRAKLISTYPKAVIATLTGLIDGRLPVTGKQVAWSPSAPVVLSPSSATGNAKAVQGGSREGGAGAQAAQGNAHTGQPADAAATQSAAAVAKSGESPGSAATATPGSIATPGSTAAPSPAAAAASTITGAPAAQVLHFVDLRSAANASVLAVQDGRVIQIGESRKLGKYIVLRDVYGDVFTYAGLGSIAPTYVMAKAPHAQGKSAAVEAASTHDPAPSQPATAGTKSPLTLSVKTPPATDAPASGPAGGHASVPIDSQEETPPGMGRVRLFAHPNNPDARAAAAVEAVRKARREAAAHRIPLRRGSVVATGTVLGRVRVPLGAKAGHLRFAIRPAGDTSTIDPGPILTNWAQLQAALHPQGAKATNALLGATASDVFLQSKVQLQRAVLSDPGITIYACGRSDIAAGLIDRRTLAVLAFLSRSGLKPTVSALRCGQGQYTAMVAASGHDGALSARRKGDVVDISAVNGIPVAHHQGPGTITDLMIRTLLTVPAEFVPGEIISLMRYPGAANTHAKSAYWNHVHLEFHPATPLSVAAADKVAHSAQSGAAAPSPIVTTSVLGASQWDRLVKQVAALPTPTVAAKPSSSAIPDPKRPTATGR